METDADQRQQVWWGGEGAGWWGINKLVGGALSLSLTLARTIPPLSALRRWAVKSLYQNSIWIYCALRALSRSLPPPTPHSYSYPKSDQETKSGEEITVSIKVRVEDHSASFLGLLAGSINWDFGFATAAQHPSPPPPSGSFQIIFMSFLGRPYGLTFSTPKRI